MKKILAIIPARAGSKRIKHKNTTPLHGIPLIDYTLRAAKKVPAIEKIVISTNDKKIEEIADTRNVQVIWRPEELASDKANVKGAILHVIEILEDQEYRPDIILLLQPTSPLRDASDIKKAITMMEDGKTDSIESVTAVSEHPSFMVRIEENNTIVPYDAQNHLKRSQDLKPLYFKNGAIYGFTYQTLKDKKGIYGDAHKAIVMPRERSIDIDTQDDLAIAERLLQEDAQLPGERKGLEKVLLESTKNEKR